MPNDAQYPLFESNTEEVRVDLKVTPAGLDEPLYAKIVEGLCSPHYYAERVHGDAFEQLLEEFVSAATALDSIKKVLFYGAAQAQPQPSYASEFKHEIIHPDIVHAIIGIATEAGELVERLIKMAHEADGDHKTNLKEESGDLGWYHQLLRNRLGYTAEEERLINARKLFKRYPEKVFAATRAAERDLLAEQLALKGE